jgi:Fur family ferric uptake transcriptional regulator
MTDTATWSQDTLAALRASSGRNGQAQRAIVDVLGSRACCLTAQELYDELRASGKHIGLASVYRVLESLSELGLVQRIDLGSGVARFEAAHPGGEHHHHLVCDDCGKVEAFSDNRLEDALTRLERQSGFAVATHEVVLHGACADCRAA